MKTIAPLELAEHAWDNVGVLVGNQRNKRESNEF
jgi:putative NIF3 family GTP cyclohydrolase 1 type 2